MGLAHSHRSRDPSRYSGLARPCKSRGPSSALGIRTPGNPRPRARAMPASVGAHGSRATAESCPRSPTHFSRAWLSEGTAEPLPPLAYMLLQAAATRAHTCQAAPLAALDVAIATPRLGPQRPEPRAGTAGIIRAGELHTAAAAAAAAAALALPTGLFSSSLPSARAVPGSARPLLLPRARPRPPPPRRPRAPLLKGRWRVHGWVPLSGSWAERARAVPARGGGAARLMRGMS